MTGLLHKFGNQTNPPCNHNFIYFSAKVISSDGFTEPLASPMKELNYIVCCKLLFSSNTTSCGLLGSVWEAQLWSVAGSHVHVH